MPQLDIYTYFTQFQWFFVIFLLIFIIINGQFIPTFQSLFVIRNFIGTLLDSKKNESKDNLENFPFENGLTLTVKPNLSGLNSWDKVYDKYRSTSTKSQIKKLSIKVNVSKKQKLTAPTAVKKPRRK